MSVLPSFRLVIIGLISAISMAAYSANDHSADMLIKMQQAVSGINYFGTLVHMSSGRAEQFRVYHRVDGQSATERIVLMDGAGAEIIRNDEEVICIFPDKRSVIVEKRVEQSVNASPLRSSLPTYTERLVEFYQITSVGMDRIAERPASIIAINPRDQYRYGYRLWLDVETAMPLKSQLLYKDDSMPLEEIRFTSISLPASIPPEDVMPGINTESFTIVKHPKEPLEDSSAAPQILWRAGNAPAGFELTVRRYEYMEGSSEPRVHLVYSDGLASVSVFLDADYAEPEQGEGLSVMGAANAYTVMKAGYLVTAMGEVPAQTVQQIALSMAEAD
jgi:sigma-E factor negative regulatory protein RseB